MPPGFRFRWATMDPPQATRNCLAWSPVNANPYEIYES